MPKRKKRKTKNDLIKHALRRFEERYGQRINEVQVHQWNKDIQEGRGKFLEKQSHTRTVFLLEGKIYAIYNNALNSICSFLT